jgi:hypothetical protein
VLLLLRAVVPPLAAVLLELLLRAVVDLAALVLLLAALERVPELDVLLFARVPLDADALRLRVDLGLSSPMTGRFFFISPALSIAPSRTLPAASLTLPAASLTAAPASPSACAAPPATSPSLSLAFSIMSGTPPDDLDLLLDLRVVLLFLLWATLLPSFAVVLLPLRWG